MSTLHRLFGTVRPFDPQHKLVTSPVVSPLVLTCIRCALAVYTLVTNVFTLVWGGVVLHNDASFFSYFTRLSYIGLSAYFWAAGVQSVGYVWRGQRWFPLQRWPRFLQGLHLILLSTIVTFPIIVTVVYWVLLADGSFDNTYDTWSNLSVHAMNTAFAGLEILFTNTPPPLWIHLPLGIVFLGCYLGVAYITHATQGFYPYSFLDPQRQGALLAAYIVGIAVGECVVFVVVKYVMVLRQRMARRFGGLPEPSGEDNLEGPLHREGRGENMDDWQDVERPKTPGMMEKGKVG